MLKMKRMILQLLPANCNAGYCIALRKIIGHVQFIQLKNAFVFGEVVLFLSSVFIFSFFQFCSDRSRRQKRGLCRLWQVGSL